MSQNPANDDIEGVEETVEADPAASADVRFPCDNCGAEMRWDPEIDALLCAYCDHRVDVPRAEGTIEERPLSEAGAAARGLGVERRVVRCDTCGATVSLDESETADACTYCGSPQVLAQAANRNAIRPESLVPLDVGRDFVEAAFRRWIRGLWFRPNALKKKRQFDAMGVYVPFWTYDCHVRSDWSADAGHYYWVTETYWTTENGKRVRKTRNVRKTRWEPAWGTREDGYDDLLVNASRGLPADLVRELGSFDLGALVPYRPAYLAGWRAEEYQVDLATGWAQSLAQVEASQRSRCAGDIPGDTHRGLRVQNTVHDTRWKHVLLPIWVVQYRVGQRAYSVLVHGQTGRIAGKAPYSAVKIAMFVLGLIGAGALVALGLALTR